MVTAHGIEVAWFYRRERKSGCCGTRMEAAEEAAATKEEEEEEGGGCVRVMTWRGDSSSVLRTPESLFCVDAIVDFSLKKRGNPKAAGV